MKKVIISGAVVLSLLLQTTLAHADTLQHLQVRLASLQQEVIDIGAQISSLFDSGSQGAAVASTPVDLASAIVEYPQKNEVISVNTKDYVIQWSSIKSSSGSRVNVYLQALDKFGNQLGSRNLISGAKIENKNTLKYTFTSTGLYYVIVEYYSSASQTVPTRTFYGDWFRVILKDDPSIKITSPVGGEVWKVGGKQTITWKTTPGTNGTVEKVRINVSSPAGTQITLLPGDIPNTGSYTYDINFIPQGSRSDYRITVEDYYSSPTYHANVFDVSQPITISQDTSAPILVVKSPSVDENVPLNKTYTVKFDTKNIALGAGKVKLYENLVDPIDKRSLSLVELFKDPIPAYTGLGVTFPKSGTARLLVEYYAPGSTAPISFYSDYFVVGEAQVTSVTIGGDVTGTTKKKVIVPAQVSIGWEGVNLESKGVTIEFYQVVPKKTCYKNFDGSETCYTDGSENVFRRNIVKNYKGPQPVLVDMSEYTNIAGVTGAPNGNYKIRVIPAGDTKLSNASQQNIDTDTQQGTFAVQLNSNTSNSVDSPTGEFFVPGDAVRIYSSLIDVQSLLKDAKINLMLQTNLPPALKTVVKQIVPYTSNNDYWWKIPADVANGNYFVQVSGTDKKGKTVEYRSKAFRIAPPQTPEARLLNN